MSLFHTLLQHPWDTLYRLVGSSRIVTFASLPALGQPPPRCRDVPSFRGGKCKRKKAVGKEKAGAMEQRRERGRKLFIHGMEKCVATRQNDTYWQHSSRSSVQYKKVIFIKIHQTRNKTPICIARHLSWKERRLNSKIFFWNRTAAEREGRERREIAC